MSCIVQQCPINMFSATKVSDKTVIFYVSKLNPNHIKIRQECAHALSFVLCNFSHYDN